MRASCNAHSDLAASIRSRDPSANERVQDLGHWESSTDADSSRLGEGKGEELPQATIRSGEQRSWSDVRLSLREMAASMADGDVDDFVNHAREWRRGEYADNRMKPNLGGGTLNPTGRTILEIDKLAIDQIIMDYDRLLVAAGEAAAAACEGALGQYFDDGLFERFAPGEEIPPREIVQGGRYNRNCIPGAGGWKVRIRFSTKDYPEVEVHFDVIDALKEERMLAILRYIEKL